MRIRDQNVNHTLLIRRIIVQILNLVFYPLDVPVMNIVNSFLVRRSDLKDCEYFVKSLQLNMSFAFISFEQSAF